MKIIVQLNRNKMLNPLQSDFKYPTDFGFPEKCRILLDSDSDLEFVTSLGGSSALRFPFMVWATVSHHTSPHNPSTLKLLASPLGIFTRF